MNMGQEGKLIFDNSLVVVWSWGDFFYTLRFFHQTQSYVLLSMRDMTV